ncbi:YceI family protein [Flavobacterium adhaerens]|uniref:YceI family protein n=1 Tax=Flavobacterium adhaerens TaxID=3149043 RepID=UPI0032B58287
MKTIIQNFLTVLVMFTLAFTSNAQKTYTLDSNPSFSVSGTSTMHDWTMKSTSGTGSANLTVTNSKLEKITSLTVTLNAETIKSEKKSMDKVAYEALKTDKFKTIKYVLKSATKINETTWSLTGSYTIAGVTKEIKTEVKTTVTNGIISMQGTNKITFKEFGMKSPTAMLGTIKTGEDLTITFSIKFK